MDASLPGARRSEAEGRLKVLVVNDYASSVGGAEILSRRLRDGLRARGHDARLFATDLRFVALYETLT